MHASAREGSNLKIYAIDTNVLIHDPNAVFNFEEHQVLVPMVVLEELDKLKVGNTALAADARHSVRTIDAILGSATPLQIMEGVAIERKHTQQAVGTLSIMMSKDPSDSILPAHSNDNRIINDLLALQAHNQQAEVVLVTKDINMRLKARGSGLRSEDYHNDQLITDIDSLTSGYHALQGSFWEQLEAIAAQNINGERYHIVAKDVLAEVLGEQIFVNQFFYDEKEFVGRIHRIEDNQVSVEMLNTGVLMRQKAWGMVPRDLFQAMAMYLLFDPEVDLVALNGAAGSGKTMLALACALEQTIETKQFKRIIATRSTRGLDEDIGFLPGSETEKMQPWLGAFTDNLEALHAEDFDPGSSQDFVGAKVPIQFKSMNFVRGRSFLQSFMIVDEAQNLTPHQIKTIITRAGQGTKVVCLGNLAQIDTPYIGPTSSGLTYMSERFKGFQHGGSITLEGVARSRLAAYAEAHL